MWNIIEVNILHLATIILIYLYISHFKFNVIQRSFPIPSMTWLSWFCSFLLCLTIKFQYLGSFSSSLKFLGQHSTHFLHHPITPLLLVICPSHFSYLLLSWYILFGTPNLLKTSCNFDSFVGSGAIQDGYFWSLRKSIN